MADENDRIKGTNDLRFVMGYDRNAGGGLQKSQMDGAEKVEASVLPDAMVHREPGKGLEKSGH